MMLGWIDGDVLRLHEAGLDESGRVARAGGLAGGGRQCLVASRSGCLRVLVYFGATLSCWDWDG